MFQQSAVDSGVSNVALMNVSTRERLVSIPQQCRGISYSLACIAQDLEALNPVKHTDSKANRASTYIAKAVGDRKPNAVRKLNAVKEFAQTNEEDEKKQAKQHGAKHSSPSNKQAKRHHHHGAQRDHPVIMTELKVGNAPSKKNRKEGMARPEGEDGGQHDDVKNIQALDERVDARKASLLSSSSSSGSSDDESVNSSLSSIDLDNFDASRWRDGLMEMLTKMQGKDEWETMSSLRKGWEFKDSERASELVHIEALSDMRDDEMKNFEKVLREMEGGLEDEQIKLLDSLNGFRWTLRTTMRDIIARRNQRLKAQRKSIFSDMKQADHKTLRRDSKTEGQESADEAIPRINFASELLNRISNQQADMSEKVGTIHLKEMASELSARALAILEKQFEAEETALMGGEAKEVPEPPPEVKELLKSVREAAVETVVGSEDREQKNLPHGQMEERTGGQPLPDISSLDNPADLGVEREQLSNLETEVQGLVLKVQELEDMKAVKLMPSSTTLQRMQKASKQRSLAVKLRDLKEELRPRRGDLEEEVLPKKAAPSSRKKEVTSSSKGDRKSKSTVQGADKVQTSVDLFEQLPRAKKQISDLRADFLDFEANIRKVEQLGKTLSLEMQDQDASHQTPSSQVMNAGSGSHTKTTDRNGNAQTKTNSSTEEVAQHGGSSGVRGQTQRKHSVTKSKRTSVSSDPQQPGANRKTNLRLMRTWKEATTELGQILKGEIPGSIESGKAVLDSKLSDLQKKKILLKELQEELQMELKPKSLEASLNLHAGGHGAGVSDSVEASTIFGESATGESNLSQRRRSRELLAERALEAADVQGSPEEIAQLLQVQGENIELQQQINQYDEIRMLVSQRQGNLTQEEKNAIKRLLFPSDGKDSVKMEVIQERKRLRTLQQEVKDKRAQWSSMDNAANALKSFQTGDAASAPVSQKMASALQKLKAVSALFSRSQNVVKRTDGISEPQRRLSAVSNSSSRRGSKLGADFVALQAAAMLARNQEQKSKDGGDALEVQPAMSSEQVKTPSASFRRVSQQIASVRRASPRTSLAGALQAMNFERMQLALKEECSDAQKQKPALEINNIDKSNPTQGALAIGSIGKIKPAKATGDDKPALSMAARTAQIRRGKPVFRGLASQTTSGSKDAEATKDGKLNSNSNGHMDASVGSPLKNTSAERQKDGKHGNRQPLIVTQSSGQARDRKPISGHLSSTSSRHPPVSAHHFESHFFGLSGKMLTDVGEQQIQTASLANKASPPKKQEARSPSKTKAVSFGEQEIHEVMVQETIGNKHTQKQGWVMQGGVGRQLLKNESDAVKVGTG